MTNEKQKRGKGNRIEIEGNLLKLYTNNKNNEPFLFDADDLELLEKYSVVQIEGEYPFAWDSEVKKNVYLHRAVMNMLDKPSSHHVDHINGNRKDNRKSNLRICHPDDATNQANPQYTFKPHERVIKKRLPNDQFALELNNGIYDFEMVYDTFRDLIKDYKLLHEQGLEKGIPTMLSHHLDECSVMMRKFESGTDEYLKAYSKKQFIEEVISETKGNKLATYQFIKENNITENGQYIVGNVIYIVGNIENVNFEIGENMLKAEPAGLHTLKPDGTTIY